MHSLWQSDSTKLDRLSRGAEGGERSPVETQCFFHDALDELRVLANGLPVGAITQHMLQTIPQETVGVFIAGKDQIHNLREEFLLTEMRLAAVGGYDQITGEIVLRGGASLLNESLNIAR